MASEEETKELSPICYDSLEHKKKKTKKKKKTQKERKSILGEPVFLEFCQELFSKVAARWNLSKGGWTPYETNTVLYALAVKLGNNVNVSCSTVQAS